ncbi:TonB-dependent receptor [Parvularcula sp. ZS-1/3]|uniref:TonB-dependent receptor n=1 Tax=Parvularcula mediterranea TaxID=2732508 RepID=A0A7Y3W471_9PROT|nr:TonB-dependent receptor [Parvularcula mediterranea]NNU15470.1 TonB-dependent receptor [Parvularcula mediterranea]
MSLRLKISGASAKCALLGSTALLALAMPTAHAQEPADGIEAAEDSDVIVVKGIRQSLRTARDTKKNSDVAVDSITASDVTQLPDLSVAEALARVPGVVVQRFELGGSDGDFPSPEGSGNIVRGLQYVRSEFNGRDAFSANGGRALEWASIPPELIGSVDVYKSQSADMIEGGIAGTVNLRTLEPFDNSGPVAVVVGEATYTDLAEEWAPGGSVVLGNRWSTDAGDWGLLGMFSTSELNSKINGFQYGQVVPVAHPDPNNMSTIGLPGGFQARDVDFERERDSIYVAGQWRSPDSTRELTVKYIRAENDTASSERTFEWFTDGESWQNWEFLGTDYNITPFTSSGLPQCNGNNEGANGGPGSCETLVPVDGGLFEAGTVSNGLRDWLGTDGTLGTPFSGLAVRETRNSVTSDLSANYKWRATDNLFLEFDAHYTEATATLDRLWAGTNVFADYEFDFSDIENPEVRLFLDDSMQVQEWAVRGGNGVPPTSLADPATSFLLFAADEFQENDGELFAWRGDATYEFDNDSWFESVKFGVRRAERKQNNRQAGLNWAGIAPPWAGGYLPFGNITAVDNASEFVDFSNFQRGGVFQGENTGVVFPSAELLNNYDDFVAFVDNEPLINTPGTFAPDWNPLRRNGVTDFAGRGADGSVTEETTNAYVRFDIASEFANGMTLDGNFGVRYTRTDILSNGVVDFQNLDAQPASFLPELAAFMANGDALSVTERDYEYYLPSLNLKWGLNDEMLIRLGISESITPPNIASLNAGGGAFAPLVFTPDPNDPMAVANIESQGTIIINGGNPNLQPIESLNFDLSYEYYFGEDGQFSVAFFHKELENIIVFGEENLGVVNLDGMDIGLDFRGETNLNDGSVSGVEVAFQQFFTELPGYWSNFGVQANYTYLQSETEPLPALEDADGDGVEGFLTVFRWGVQDLLGLSEHNYNLVGLYQTDKFEARLAYNWRSEYFSSYRDFITGNPIIQDDIGFLDASLRYDLTDNLQFRILGANLLDTKAVAFQQIDQEGQRFGRSVFTNDRRFEVGVRYSFF